MYRTFFTLNNIYHGELCLTDGTSQKPMNQLDFIGKRGQTRLPENNDNLAVGEVTPAGER